MSSSTSSHPKEKRWSRPLTIAAVSLLVFEIVTGLAIWLLPFSLSAQMTVLAHTVGGVVLLGPYLVYQIRHWKAYFSDRTLDYLKLTGYVSLAATVVALVTGLVLTVQALFGREIGQMWSEVHLLSTFVLLATLLIHVLGPIVRGWGIESGMMDAIRRAQLAFSWNVVFHLGVGVALVALSAYAISPTSLYRDVPDSYEQPYGADSLFAPSLAQTDSDRLLNPEALGGSESCGASGCHEQIYDEWAPSAHRYSAMDPAFRAIQKRMADRKGPFSTRYCGGCHDPISLLSGNKSMLKEAVSHDIGYDEGTSCMSCHSVKEADVRGNADYVIDPPKRYLGELEDGALAKTVSHFLIRAYPEYHNESLSKPLYKTPEYCGTCHKQFIDESINDVGWVQLQNQYDNWRKSRWHRPEEPTETIECRECHMPLVDSFDPASGDEQDYNRSADDGKHRSHRFQAANQVMPVLLDLPGGKEQVAAVKDWLKGEYEIPEISDKWTDGPVAPLEILAPDTVQSGQEVEFRVRVTNNKAGHNFPTGPLDAIQSWIRITAVTASGDTLLNRGQLTEDHFLESSGTLVFKAEPVDQTGNLVDFHNLWEMVGTRYARSIFPGFSDQATYQLEVPSVASRSVGAEESDVDYSSVRIEADLEYRKFNQSIFNELAPLMNELVGGTLEAETVPVTTLSSDVRTITVTP